MMKIEYVTNHDDWCYLLIDGETVDEGHNTHFDYLIESVIDNYNKREVKPAKIEFKSTSFESSKDPDGVLMSEYVDANNKLAVVLKQTRLMSAEMDKYVYDLYHGQPDDVTPPFLRPVAIAVLKERGILTQAGTLSDIGILIAQHLTKVAEEQTKHE